MSLPMEEDNYDQRRVLSAIQPFRNNMTIGCTGFSEEKQEQTNLLEEIDKQVMVLLRDGTTMFGKLRSIDEFSNIILTQAIERIYVGNKYGDIPRGVFIIRGDNLALVGEVGEPKEKILNLQEVSVDEILCLQKNILEDFEDKEQQRTEALKQQGLHHPRRNKNQAWSEELKAFRLGEDQFE